MTYPFPKTLAEVGTIPEDVVADMTKFEAVGSWSERGGKPEWFQKMEFFWFRVTSSRASLETLKNEAWKMAAKEAVVQNECVGINPWED